MSAHILIIEDHPANLELMVFLLRAYGHTVLSAPDGLAGMALATSAIPDLIICDIHLPGMDGYAVVRTLKNKPALARIPLIAVTALAMVGDRESLLRAGFDGYFAKPIEPTTFVPQLEAFLPADLRATIDPTDPTTRTHGHHTDR